MAEQPLYDVVIIGGGLAGLSCAWLLAQRKRSVLLLEKEHYPLHRVCGEYISMESHAFLKSAGLQLEPTDVPFITKLVISSPSGKKLSHDLPLGGFGISRFKADHDLANAARNMGAHIAEGVKATGVLRKEGGFIVESDRGEISAQLVCAAFGKRSNLDLKWKRPFAGKKHGALNNFIGVKYHAVLDRPADTIELHNFSNGYCGISPIEDGKSCICYLTKAMNLRANGNAIDVMEDKVLFSNPHLKDAFDNATMLYEKPLTISQVSFENKSQFENGILFMGDAASMIAPLCGNGMSMAIHAARIACTHIESYLGKQINLEQLGDRYTADWRNRFGKRLTAGRIIQSLFGNPALTNMSISVMRTFPGLLTRVIRQTHG